MAGSQSRATTGATPTKSRSGVAAVVMRLTSRIALLAILVAVLAHGQASRGVPANHPRLQPWA
eukprot:6654847-Prorocentrum_lima.AAC.1